MKLVPLTRGQYAMVDDIDYEWISQKKWRFDRYAVRTENYTTVYLHRLIMRPPKGLVVDHINGNRLDNRRENLRVCTHSQNLTGRNTGKGLRGVSFDKSRGKWKANICINYKKIHIGRFNTAQEAALAYNQRATELYGEFARTN